MLSLHKSLLLHVFPHEFLPFNVSCLSQHSDMLDLLGFEFSILRDASENERLNEDGVKDEAHKSASNQPFEKVHLN